MIAAIQQKTDLALFSKVRAALSKATTLQEVMAVRGEAEAARAWAKTVTHRAEIMNAAAELKLRAERKAGEMLAGMSLHGGDRKSSCRDGSLMSDLGIDEHQSHRWRKIASVDEDAFEEHIESYKEANKELTTASVLRLAANPTPENEIDYGLYDAVRHMRRLTKRMAQRWPQEDLASLPPLLRCLANEVEDGTLLLGHNADGVHRG